jgi:hypothetical protein
MLLLMDPDGSWGICEPPIARVRGDPLPFGWSKFGGGAMRVQPEPPVLQNGLPAQRDAAWWPVCLKLARTFVSRVGGGLNPPVRASSLRFAHPDNERQVDALRAIYNGEVPEPDGGCLPRVWRWEHEGQIWWLVELPPHLEYAWRSLLPD